MLCSWNLLHSRSVVLNIWEVATHNTEWNTVLVTQKWGPSTQKRVATHLIIEKRCSRAVVLNPNCFATRNFDIFFSTTRNWGPLGQFLVIQLIKVENSWAHDPFKICQDPLPGRDPSVENNCSIDLVWKSKVSWQW